MFIHRLQVIEKKKEIIVWVVFLAISLLPLLFWGKYYSVGGDDGKLYYLFPWEYFKNFTLNSISDNILGALGTYFSQSYISGFALTAYILKTALPFLNTQYLMLGLNLGFGFLFFYKLLGLWIRNEENEHNFFIRIAGAVFYCFSTFTLGYTVWMSQLFSIYVISIFPVFLYLFLKSVQENKAKYLISAALVLSVFSIVLMSVPWFFGIIICLLPFLLFIFWQNKKVFMKNSLFLVLLLILLNFYWLFNTVYSLRNSDRNTNSFSAGISSDAFREQNEAIISSVTLNNHLIYPFFNLFHRNIQIDYGWLSYGVYKNWHEKMVYINFIFILVLLLGAIFAGRSDKYRKIYPFLLSSFLLAIFFFTVKIGNWGVPFFLFLNNYVPGFTMFRNMYDKFGLALVFSYSLLLAFSLKIIIDEVKLKNIRKDGICKNILCALVIIVIIIQAKPFILGEYYQSPIWTTKSIYPKILDFNDDFYKLVDYLKSRENDGGRYLWLPLNMANYALIEDKINKNYYYSGVSPLQFLAGKQDFASYMSFGKASRTFLEKLIIDKNYQYIQDFYRKMNVNYVIVDNTERTKEFINSYLFGARELGDFYKAQAKKEYRQKILGEKIRDFGARYSLYAINKEYYNRKIYLAPYLNDFPDNFNQVEFQKVASYQYNIKINSLRGRDYLVFLDPYHELWELRFAKDGRIFKSGSHLLVYNYANGWDIDGDAIRRDFDKSYYQENSDGSINLELLLYFKPQVYFYPSLAISGSALLFCLGYLGYEFIKRRKKI